MNEPNQPAFLRPQFGPSGANVSAAVAGAFLAAGYDALKAVDPTIVVIGLGLSPRGNDRPTAPSNVSTSPVRFLDRARRVVPRERPDATADGRPQLPPVSRIRRPTRSSAATRGRTPASPTSTGSSRRSGTRSATRRSRRPSTASGSTSTRSAGRSTPRACPATPASRTCRSRTTGRRPASTASSCAAPRATRRSPR